MPLPGTVSKIRLRRRGVSGAIRGRDAIEGAVDANAVVIGAEFFELPVKIDRIPEEHVIQIFAADCPDQSFHEWVHKNSQLHVS